MKLPIKRTLDRLDAIHAGKADGRLEIPIQVSRVANANSVNGENPDRV